MKTDFSGCLALRAILVHKPDQLSSLLALKGLLELVNGWGNLQALLQHCLLTLETHILGPSQEPAQITLGLNISTNTEIPGTLLKERINYLLWWGRLLCNKGGCSNLLPLGGNLPLPFSF